MRYWKTCPIPGSPLVGVLVVTYNQPLQLPVLMASYRAQTYGNFRILTVHDGPDDGSMDTARKVVAGDNRFAFCSTPKRRKNHGHPIRAEYLSLIDGDWVGTTNGDNYYIPVFFEGMLRRAIDERADMVYCSLVHSHLLWKPMPARLARGKIDCGCWLAKKDLVASTPWRDMGFAGDWTYIDDLRKRAGKVVHWDAYAMVHN